MRILAVALLVLTGCYSPSYRDCEVTCASGSCPSGFSCEQGVCRAAGFSGPCGQMNGDGSGSGSADAMIDGNMNLDSDGDGKNDAIDNCRTIPNPDQANEDGDTFGDVCDPCPPYKINPQDNTDANLDPDGDGVGNGCDPNPMAFGEKIVLFDGFNVFMSGTLVGSATTMNIGNGVATIIAQQGGQWGAATFSVTADLTKRQYVMAGVHVNQIFPDTASQVHGAAALLFFDGTSRGIGCMYGENNMLSPALMLSELNGNNPLLIAQAPVPQTIPDIAVHVRSRSAGTYECASVPQMGGMLNGNSPLPTPAQTRVGVYARSADIRFPWMLFVEGP